MKIALLKQKKLLLVGLGILVISVAIGLFISYRNNGDDSSGDVAVASTDQIVSLTPIGDTTIKKSYETKNYGSDKLIISDGKPLVQALLKFDISNVNKSNISKVELILTPRSQREIDKKVYTTANWDEKTVTWRTKPLLIENVGNYVGRIESSKPFTINLDSSKVFGDSNSLSLLIDDITSGETIEFASKESTSGPGAVLRISYTAEATNPVETPTPTPTPDPTPTPNPTTPTSGIWISTEEIMSLPMSGTAWDKLLATANSDWGTANLGDNDSKHDVYTLAGALVAVRKSDNVMREKTINGLKSAMSSSLTRTLELSRGLQTYIIAADIIGYHDPAFEKWVRDMVNNTAVSPHKGGTLKCNTKTTDFDCSGKSGLICTAVRSSNNWGGHARASLAAAAIYLNDQSLKDYVVNAHKAFIGVDTPNYLHCTDTNWHANTTNRYGVNKSGTTIQGQNVSGVLPEDWRRGGEFTWPPAPTGYMWEGMQGYVVTAVILHRAGLVPFNSGDNSVVRSMDQLYSGVNNPASGDDTWIPWVVNKYAGTNYPTLTALPGKNMGWTDWTFGK